MTEMTPADVLMVDEMDQTLLDYPYAFKPNDSSEFNGIWNWK